MKIRSVFSLVSFLFVAFAVAAQSNASFSTPLDIPQVGWNKVLCMKNGHTMLFHFEVNKPMIIKVFDSTHKEIASQKYSGKLLDQSKFMTSLFQGCFEVNGEAVLFLYQEHVSKPCLFRMRVNDTTGMVTEEKIVGESISVSKPTQYLVTKGKDQNGYTITSFTYTRGVKERDLHLSIFNMYHQIIRVIPLPIIAETDDDVDLLSCDHTQGGINAAICTRKMEENSTVHRNAEINTIDDYDHIVTLYFVPTEIRYRAFIPLISLRSFIRTMHIHLQLFCRCCECAAAQLLGVPVQERP